MKDAENQMDHILDLHSGSIYLDSKGHYFFVSSSGERSSSHYRDIKDAVEAYYIEEARDYFGCAVRDNSRAELIEIGKGLDEGTLDDSDCL